MTFDLRTRDKAAEVAEAEARRHQEASRECDAGNEEWFVHSEVAHALKGIASAIRALPAAQGGWMPIETWKYLGELYAAAKHDFEQAGWDEIGLHGVPIKHWREAYCEGIKDAAEGFASRLPEDQREAVKKLINDAYAAKTERLAAPPPPSQEGDAG
jgi:hypothetical protein